LSFLFGIRPTASTTAVFHPPSKYTEQSNRVFVRMEGFDEKAIFNEYSLSGCYRIGCSTGDAWNYGRSAKHDYYTVHYDHEPDHHDLAE
jgi:hypothetical protein